jgi:4-hydroxy-tetrahydrodipicolinate synthase
MQADYISFAIPRQFMSTEADLLDYCATICDAVNRPILIQDFNPRGPTLRAEFASSLRARCANFRYVKLEEPLMAGKVRAIQEASAGTVGVMAGWGGLQLLSLIPAGICGVMPGLAVADLMQRTWQLAQAGATDEAYELFQKMLPQLAFSLQDLELFLFLEKNCWLRVASCQKRAHTSVGRPGRPMQ